MATLLTSEAAIAIVFASYDRTFAPFPKLPDPIDVGRANTISAVRVGVVFDCV